MRHYPSSKGGYESTPTHPVKSEGMYGPVPVKSEGMYGSNPVKSEGVYRSNLVKSEGMYGSNPVKSEGMYGPSSSATVKKEVEDEYDPAAPTDDNDGEQSFCLFVFMQAVNPCKS